MPNGYCSALGASCRCPLGRLLAIACRVIDGYAGYNLLIAPDRPGLGIQLAYCWAHTRRKLIEITRTGPAPIAEVSVALIRDFYAIEADIRGNDHATRLAAREERSAPIPGRLDNWLRHHRARASAKYRDGLGRFLTDGGMEIDNDTSSHDISYRLPGNDRTHSHIALNRKNALFAHSRALAMPKPCRATGHDAGAENWAIIASLIETCKMNAVDPHAWRASTLKAIVSGHKQSQIVDLLPGNCVIKL